MKEPAEGESLKEESGRLGSPDASDSSPAPESLEVVESDEASTARDNPVVSVDGREKVDSGATSSSEEFIPRKEYQRAAWKHFIRYFVVFTIVVLNFSSVMSTLTRVQSGRGIDPMFELFTFAMVGVVNLLFLLPVVFEVNKVIVDSDSIWMSTLFFRRRVKWEQISSFEQPRMLKYGIVWTGRCFYLINKRDLMPYDQLARTIQGKVAQGSSR